MRRILMVAYHFPPLAGSSGIQRTLRFVQHLPRYGWEPMVLSADPRAYERTGADLLDEIPAATVVQRAFALDTARHLSFRGRYIGALARPDRWSSWRFDGVRRGMQMIRRYRPDAIWSTYPIATAHLIGAGLQRRSGLPWVADFRDPMAQDGYPVDPLTRQQYLDIEQLALYRARQSIFSTPGAAQVYRDRYPRAASRVAVIENGYDESSFADAEQSLGAAPAPLHAGCLSLLHSGIVYPSERDPTQLFEALGLLRERGSPVMALLRVRFRASVHDELLLGLARRHGVQDQVEVLPAVPYRDALCEMLRADGLLLMQAANCNEQIPAKLYEYLRAGRPLLCLSDPLGDTCKVLTEAGVHAMARLDSAAEIAVILERWAGGDNASFLPSAAAAASASRQARAQQLAACLDRL